jgi:hypothetical protein
MALSYANALEAAAAWWWCAAAAAAAAAADDIAAAASARPGAPGSEVIRARAACASASEDAERWISAMGPAHAKPPSAPAPQPPAAGAPGGAFPCPIPSPSPVA